MQTAFLTLHVIVCLVLIVLVLLQAGKEGMGVIFGGGGNTSVFGSSGAGGILVKLTGFLAVLFIVTSLAYNLITSPARQAESVLDVQFEEIPAPVVPTTPPGTTTSPVPAAQPEPAAPAESPFTAVEPASTVLATPETTPTPSASDVTPDTAGTPDTVLEQPAPAMEQTPASEAAPQ